MSLTQIFIYSSFASKYMGWIMPFMCSRGTWKASAFFSKSIYILCTLLIVFSAELMEKCIVSNFRQMQIFSVQPTSASHEEWCFCSQTSDLAPSAVLINSNFKTMMSLLPNQCVSANWSFLAFVLICPLRL